MICCNRVVSTLIGLLFLALATNSLAQNRTVDLYLDNVSGSSGCDVSLVALGTTLEQLDRRLSVTINTETGMVTDVATSSCTSGSFSPQITIDGGYPVGLNTGLNNSDAVEFAASLAELNIATGFSRLSLYLVAENPETGGQDILAGSDDGTRGLGLDFTHYQPIPTLGIGTVFLLLLLVLLTGLVYAKRYNKASLLGLLLLSGLVIAANYLADGDVLEWSGVNPFATDPSGDPLPDEDPSIDIEALFVHFDGTAFLFRVDLQDIEGGPENTQPEADSGTETTLEDIPVVITLKGDDTDGDSLTFTVSSSPASGSLGAISQLDASSASITYTPGTDFNGADGFSFIANDGKDDSSPALIDITVNPLNDVPSFVLNNPAAVLQDSGPQSIPGTATSILAGPADESTQVLVFNITANTNPALFSAGPLFVDKGPLSFTSAAGIVGTASITIELMDDGGTADGGVDTSPAQVLDIVVDDVNDQPFFTIGPDQNVSEDSGPQSIAAWATGIDAGAPDEAGQVLTFNVTGNTNPSLFSTVPSIDATTGTLSYAAAADANGTADITLQLMDDGGTADGGIDTSASQLFTITVDAVNDVPSFVLNNPAPVLQDSGPQSIPGTATSILAGPADESTQVLVFNITSNTNPALFSAGPLLAADGTLSFTPAAGNVGTASITIELMDDGGTTDGGVDTSPTQVLDIVVDDVNARSFLPVGPGQNVTEDSGPQSIAAWATGIDAGAPDEAGQVLTFNVTGNTNSGLFSTAPSIDAATGTLSYAAAADANGTADITLQLMDDGGTADGGIDTSASQLFTITVGAVNDVPAFIAGADGIVDENAGAQTVIDWATGITAGPANESGQTVIFNVINDNNALFAMQPSVSSTGVLSYTPATNANGVATVSVAAVDDGGTANGGIDTSPIQMFSITVNPVNSSPVLVAIGNKSIDEMVELTFTASATDPGDTPPDNLSFSLSGEPAGAAIDAGTGMFSWTPTEAQGAAGAAGMYTFDVIVMDDGVPPLSDSESITITVNEANQNPLAADDFYASTGNVGISVPAATGLITGDTDPDLPAQTLTYIAETVASSNGGSAMIATDGGFVYTPPAGFTGDDTFSYTVNDGAAGSDTGTVTVTVSELIWFMDNSKVAVGDGTLIAPFNSIVEYSAAVPAATSGCLFFDETGSGDYTGPLSLADNQVLVGKGASGSIDNECVVTLAPNSLALPATNGSRPVLASNVPNVNVLTLASANKLTGFNLNQVNASAVAISGDAVGALKVSNVSSFGSGGALQVLVSGNFASDVNFDTVQCNTIDRSCIELNGVNGTMDITSGGAGIASSGAQAAIHINAATASLSYPGNITYSGSAEAIRITDHATGTLTFGGAVSASNGSGLQFINSDGTYNFNATVTLNGGDAGIDILSDSNGNFTFVDGGSSIINPTGAAFSMGGGSNAIVDYRGTITQNNAVAAVAIINGSSVISSATFSGAISASTGISKALDLDNFGTANFSGGLTITTTSGGGLGAVNSGTINITGANNQVTSTTGTAVTISNAAIGINNVTFRSVSVDGAPSGIVLLNSGIGSFIVTGDGSKLRNASGGTIQNTTQDGIQLNNASNISLQSISLLNAGDSADSSNGGNNLVTNDHAIQSEGGSNIILSGVHIQAPAAGGWEAVNLGGSNRIDSDSLIEGIDTSNMQALEVRNTDTDMTLFSIDGSEITDQAATNGSSYVLFNGFGSSVMAVTVNNSTLSDIFGQALQINAGEGLAGTGTITTNITGSTFQNALPGNIGVGASGGIGGIIVSSRLNAIHNYNVDGNTFTDLGRPLVNGDLVSIQGIGGTGKTLDGVINNNNINRIGFTLPTGPETSGGYRVIGIVTENDIDHLDGETTNNSIDETGREAIYISSRGNSKDFDASIIGNTLGQTSAIGRSEREAVEVLSEDNSIMAVVIDNNLVNGNADFDQIVDIDSENTSIMDISFTNNTVSNLLTGPEIVVDTEGGLSSLCLAFTDNTAVEVEFDVDGVFQVENFANRVANNPGVTTFVDGVGVTDVGAGTCLLPTF